MEQLRSKKPSAVQAFVKGELPRVFALCKRLCGQTADAEDLCQEVFVRAVRGLDGFKGEAALSTWLHRITINTWKNKLRSEHRRKSGLHVSLSASKEDADGAPALDLPETAPTPEETAMRQDAYYQLSRSLDALDPEEKSILVLRDMEGRTYEEIAELLDLNVGTIKSRLSRARDRLRETFYRLGGRLV